MSLEWADLRVLAVGGAGIGSALVEIDIAVKLLISILSLLYVGKKTWDLYKRKNNEAAPDMAALDQPNSFSSSEKMTP